VSMSPMPIHSRYGLSQTVVADPLGVRSRSKLGGSDVA
jgi:hypothetical protein